MHSGKNLDTPIRGQRGSANVLWESGGFADEVFVFLHNRFLIIPPFFVIKHAKIGPDAGTTLPKLCGSPDKFCAFIGLYSLLCMMWGLHVQ